MTPQELSDTLGLHSIFLYLLFNYLAIRGRPWQIAKCSAKSGDGLQSGIEWVLDNIKK